MSLRLKSYSPRNVAGAARRVITLITAFALDFAVTAHTVDTLALSVNTPMTYAVRVVTVMSTQYTLTSSVGIALPLITVLMSKGC